MLAGLEVEDAASSLNVKTEKEKSKYDNQKGNYELSQYNSKETHPMPEGRDQHQCRCRETQPKPDGQAISEKSGHRPDIALYNVGRRGGGSSPERVCARRRNRRSVQPRGVRDAREHPD